jgi:ferredoxin
MEKLTVSVDRDKCQGYGKCSHWAPATFSLDAENKVQMGDPGATEDPAMLVRAAKSCPYRVITVSDEERQIFPPIKKPASA